MAIGSFSLPISSGSTEWVRPSDWLPMPTGITSANQTFVGLYAIFPNGNNFAAFLFTTSTGQYRVDWGDGTVTLHNSNTIAQYEYNYALISNSTLTSRGYKQSIITVTAVSGNLLTCNFQQRFVTSPVQNVNYSTGFLDCILSMPNATASGINFSGFTVKHSYVERFDIKTIGNCTSLSILFTGCNSLQSVPLFDTANVVSMTSMFTNCVSLKSVPLFNTSLVTNMPGMFQGCSSIQTVPLFNMANVTNISLMFSNCVSLQSIPLFNTPLVTNMSGMFNNCTALQSIPALLTTSITTLSGLDFGANFAANCNSLDRCEMVFSRTVSFSQCQLSKSALVEIFTNLTDRILTTPANINITGNWGASALSVGDRLIATAKNWTITG